MTGPLGRRYARAILSLASDEGRLDEVGEELTSLAAAFAEPELHAVLRNPALGAGTRREVASRIADALGASPIVANAVRLLADRDRLAVFEDVSRAYRRLVDRELGRSRVVVRSAAPLSEEDRVRVIELARGLAGREVLATSEVQPDLLGGVVLDVGGLVYDGSVKTQLERMSKRMTVGED